jgi:hypothetical protein
MTVCGIIGNQGVIMLNLNQRQGQNIGWKLWRWNMS